MVGILITNLPFRNSRHIDISYSLVSRVREYGKLFSGMIYCPILAVQTILILSGGDEQRKADAKEKKKQMRQRRKTYMRQKRNSDAMEKKIG